jgi:hypothetical protein
MCVCVCDKIVYNSGVSGCEGGLSLMMVVAATKTCWIVVLFYKNFKVICACCLKNFEIIRQKFVYSKLSENLYSILMEK